MLDIYLVWFSCFTGFQTDEMRHEADSRDGMMQIEMSDL